MDYHDDNQRTGKLGGAPDDLSAGKQKIVDEEHLRLLVIAHYIIGVVAAVYSCIFIFYVAMGLLMSHTGMFAVPANLPPVPGARAAAEPDPRLFDYFLVGFGIVALVLGWIFSALTIFAGRCIAMRSNYTFSLVIAGLHCLLMPIGTALGIATFIVLLRPSVSDLFGVPRRVASYSSTPPPGYAPTPAV